MSFALITGASKGIGKAIATELAKKKTDVLLVAQSEAELKNLKENLQTKFGIRAEYFATDLSQLDAAKKVKQWCDENKFQVHILINNAGFATWGWFEKENLEVLQKMMRVNMNAMVELTYEFLPMLRKNSKAYIMNTASTAAYQAVATTAIYAATKAFVLSFTRGLRYELKKTHISVTCLSPGPTDTNFINRAGMHALQSTADKFNMSPEKVAKLALKAMFSGRAEIIAGFPNWLGAQLAYIMPKGVVEKIAAGIYEKKLQR